jgi:acyl transferase domain-containing protein/NADPH:quinone reductase-like Zn-dependent oxidoreductase/short-subunit dehydrogenase
MTDLPEPIAIVGIGCRFAGADGPAELWRLLRGGTDAISQVSRSAFDLGELLDSRPGTPGKLISRWGGFVDQPEYFDNGFFGISPREAERMDPQQRLLLEVAWEALEDAGQPPAKLAGSSTGVFVGVSTCDYEDLQLFLRDRSTIDLYAGTGSTRSILAGRLSYVFDLHGPSLTIDTACSSSLVAVHLACQSLRAGECGLALAAGVNLVLLPEQSLVFSQAGMLSPDGRCKFADQRADGFVRSDGVGVVVLKPLRQARADGDAIHALVRGSAVNNDGRGSGFLTTPAVSGQQELLRRAYANAGVSPAEIQYLEAHGTGTAVGDPVEVQAIAAVVAEGRPPERPCLLGSVKSNIGHTEGAAGVAGLIKVALALAHHEIPPSLHVRQLTDRVAWSEMPLAVVRQLTPWPASAGAAKAGVSSFGICGTNAHAVLQEAPPPASAAMPPPAAGPGLLTLSAHTREALAELARRAVDWLAGEAAAARFGDLCGSLAERRAHHDWRLALVAASHDEAAAGLTAFLAGDSVANLTAAASAEVGPRVVFVFPGQGSQWLGMGRGLLDEPVFAAAIRACDAAVRRWADWSIFEQLAAPPEASRLAEIDVVQPLLFAVQVALAALWRSWGIEPDAVVGTSMGEVAAACVAGALSLDDAARVIARRSLLLRRKRGQGGMLVVDLSLTDARNAIAAHQRQVSIAVSNGPASTVLSGDPQALAEIARQLEAAEVFCRQVKVDVASHSPQMDDLREELLAEVAGIRPAPPAVPFHSTVTGRRVAGGELAANYWARNLREPVMFGPVVEELVASGHHAFVEISPHPLLLGAVGDAFRQAGRTGLALPSLLRDEDERRTLLGSLGALHCAGAGPDWRRVHPGPVRFVRPPALPWQRERFWRDDRPVAPPRRERAAGQGLLDGGVPVAGQPGTRLWQLRLDPRAVPWLADHRLQGAVLTPAAAWLVMALQAAATLPRAGGGQAALAEIALEEVALRRALFLPEDRPLAVQLALTREAGDRAGFRFLSADDDGSDGGDAWILHADGRVRSAASAAVTGPGAEPLPLAEIRSRCANACTAAEHYQRMHGWGLDYGTSFQGVTALWRGSGEALARVAVPAAAGAAAAGDLSGIHPGFLDSCLQVLYAEMLASLPEVPGEGAHAASYLPAGCRRLRITAALPSEVWCWARVTGAGEAAFAGLEGDLVLADLQGCRLGEVLGLRVAASRETAAGASPAALDDWMHEIRWERVPEPVPMPAAERPPGPWLILGDRGGLGPALQSALAAAGVAAELLPARSALPPAAPGSPEALPSPPPEACHASLVEALRRGPVPFHGVVHLASLDVPPLDEAAGDGFREAQRLTCDSVLAIPRAVAEAGAAPPARICLVTRGAQPAGMREAPAAHEPPLAVAQALLWGCGRALLHEHSELGWRLLDLDPVPTPGDAGRIVAELFAGDAEDQLARRGGARFAARLARRGPPPRAAAAETQVRVGAAEPFRLEIRRPGVLDHLALRRVQRTPVAPGQVEIRVRAAGLNFRDVMLALGIYPGQDGRTRPGTECAGEVVAVGEGAPGVAIGDAVLCLAPDCFGSYATADARLVFPKRPDLDWQQAATLPIAFLTAWHALHEIGRLRRGERVLIHRATGGVGLAAVQLARLAGARILATAGSEDKRRRLRELGVEQVFDSRGGDFAAAVLQATGGEGVDLVLNSLPGDAIEQGLAILRRNGRFLEIGRTEVYDDRRIGLLPFRNNLSLHVVDIYDRIFCQDPQPIAAAMREILERIGDGRLRPLPVTELPLADPARAFHHMAQSRHVGKIALAAPAAGEQVTVLETADPAPELTAGGTWWISGGLGGLGLTVAEWLVDRGVRHLALSGRRGPGPAAGAALARMRRAGARVEVMAADVAVREEVQGALGRIGTLLPPLAAIVHAAAVLDDGVALQLTPERTRSVLAPKVRGAWNLWDLAGPGPRFVLFSSAASVVGSPGQASYCAANAFLDVLAHELRRRGARVSSVNWGPWSEVGLAARPDRGGRLAQRGLGSIAPEQGLAALARVLEEDPAQVAVMPFDPGRWQRFYPQSRGSSLLRGLARGAAEAPGPAPLAGGNGAPAGETLAGYLTEQVARVLRLPAAKVSADRPLIRMGIDSLMAVELKNRIASDLGMVVPLARILKGVSVTQLAALMAGETAAPAAAVPPAPGGEPGSSHAGA